MPLDLKPMRSAHSEGRTDVCYDDNGRYLITCGSDGDVRIYDGFDDDDPDSFRAGDTITAVTFKDNKIVTGTDNVVQIYKFPGGSPDGILARFTGIVNHLSYSPSGKYLAAGGSEFKIKVVEVSDSSHKYLYGHEAPVLSLSFDPDEEFLVSSSCDGTLKIWDWKEPECLKSFDLFPKTNDMSPSQSLCRFAFQPNGKKLLAVPVDKEIMIYEKTTWNNIFTLKEENSTSESISIVSWSPCGKYLASASINGEILIWCINSKCVIERTKHSNSLTITCLVWNPKMNGEIAYTDNQGQLGVCADVISSELKTVSGAKKAVDGVNDIVDELLNNDDFDSASESGSLLGAKKRHRVKNAWFDEEADENGPDDDNGDDDDENTTDIGKIKAELAGPMGLEDEESNQMIELEDNNSVTAGVSVGPIVIQQPQIVQQPPFQPGSTPSHLMHRFMVWNYVGIVRCHSEEEEPSSIDIEFHDTSLHHAMQEVNQLNHTMAALSNVAVLLACQAQEELPSQLLCLHFGAWVRSKKWTISMPQGEDIVAIAVGNAWAAVATDHDYLHIFTLAGIQANTICLPGAVVSMSGHDNQLLVVYHCGVGVPSYQCLGVKLIDVNSNTQVIDHQRLPLSPKATLSWLGFSLEGTPSTVDSLGVVRLLNRSFGHTWIPVANTKSQTKRPSDNYWVIGLTESSEQIRCVLCTGSTCPPTLPRPLVSTLPLQLPVCEIATEKGQLEEEYLRTRLLANRFDYQKQCGVTVDEEIHEESQTKLKQLLMKMFALACKSDRDCRAEEICQFLPDAHSVSLAIRYAARNHKMRLAERLDELARRKAEEEEAAAEAAEEEELCESDVELQEYSQDIRALERSSYRESGYRGNAGKVPRMSERRNEDENDDDTEEEAAVEEKGEDQEDVEDEEIEDSMSELLLKPTDRQESSRRSNPFKVSSGKNKTNNAVPNKLFFQSVEKEKSIMAKKASNRASAPEKPKTSKQGKQATLFNIKKPKKDQKHTEETKAETPKPPNKPRVNPFQCWFEDIQSFLNEEYPELSDEEIMKIAMKQWRETPKDEKQFWEKKAKGEVTDEKITECEENETPEKKRKRNVEAGEEKEAEDSDETTEEEKDNISKKAKVYDKRKVGAKLAGFAFSKN